MKFVKHIIGLLSIFLILSMVVFAEDTFTAGFNITIDSELNTSIEASDLYGNVDNSELEVNVIKCVGELEFLIYTGPLKNYDNGAWIHTDFSNSQMLAIFDWNTLGEEVVYIIPMAGNRDSAVEDVNANTSGFVNSEEDFSISDVQHIEYDVTYRVTSDERLCMDIDYNVYNNSLETDTVMLIAALYEDGVLSDMQTQSLSIEALDSNMNSIILPLPDDCENYSVKLMVWEDLITLKPIGNVKHVSDLDSYIREKSMHISLGANMDFTVYMNAATVKGANTEAVHTINYDPSKILLVDLCGFTYNKELTAGEIENTDVIIENVDLLEGKIEYKFNLHNGRNTGVTNLIKFKTITNLSDEVIIYTIQ